MDSNFNRVARGATPLPGVLDVGDRVQGALRDCRLADRVGQGEDALLDFGVGPSQAAASHSVALGRQDAASQA